MAMGRTLKNISIKDSLAAIKKKKDEGDDVIEEVIDTSFSNEKLIECWKSFISSYINTSPSFANAIAKYDPVLKDNFCD